ncbi:MAG TPA: histidine kinase [Actinophytocola sp.]|uniref:sensor histidine kinase n=1 Tax=Actinophytocola sp. TaxID=1872138 RepID=UPI002DDCC407|nr:histidine kinase [Actinophytocola sp.]HEV2780779.1 histidine kinase [Actinophytocola sp.]
MPRAIFGPVVRPSTYRRWVYLILGGAVLVPFILLAAFILPSLLPARVPAWLVIGSVVVLVVGVSIPVSFIPAVRVIEGTAARELLGDGVPEQAGARAMSWESRWRFAGWFVLHLIVGGVISTLTLALPPTLVLSLLAPFTGSMDVLGLALRFPTGLISAWVPVAALLGLVVLAWLVIGTTTLAIRAAPFLLGPTAAERLAELQRRTESLAERNRLARELHDSVGHALSIVTIQASAARRVLDTDPAFAHRALGAIEESARGALAELDHVLGLLREDRSADTPQWTLADLPRLLDKTRIAGVDVKSTVEGQLAAVPAVVSREAYRILQECLTNVARHAGRVPVALRLAASDDELALDLSNPLGNRAAASRNGGGRGLAGMRERVTVLRGQMTAGPEGDRWRVSVRIPLGKGGRG